MLQVRGNGAKQGEPGLNSVISDCHIHVHESV